MISNRSAAGMVRIYSRLSKNLCNTSIEISYQLPLCINLHVFCDESERAYGAFMCIYVQVDESCVKIVMC